MASKPPALQILDEIAARLGNISTANGYSIDLRKIERARLTPWEGYDMPAVNYWYEPDRSVDRGMGYDARELLVRIEFRDKTYESTPFTDLAANMALDAWVALWRDPGAPAVSDNPSSRLGDLVSYLNFEDFVPAVGEGQTPYCGSLLELTVGYKIDPGDPFTIKV